MNENGINENQILETLKNQWNASSNKTPAAYNEIIDNNFAANIPAEQKENICNEFRKYALPFADFNDYEKLRYSYDEKNDFFAVKTFNKFRFANQTLSYIGARPSRGKTTFLQCLAHEAIEQGKPVIFLTVEETAADLYDRFILHELYKQNVIDSNNYGALTSNFITNLEDGRQDVFIKFYAALRRYVNNKNNSLNSDLVSGLNDTMFKAAYEKIKEYQDKGLLKIFDAIGRSQNDIMDIIARYPNHIVLVDYIQRIPCKTNDENQQRTVQMQNISRRFANAAILNNQIIIAGAQFNRNNNTNTRETKRDVFSDGSFRESGDLEADAVNAIGLGYDKTDPEKITYFYEILKGRKSGGMGIGNNFIGDMKFSYMQAESKKPAAKSKTNFVVTPAAGNESEIF